MMLKLELAGWMPSRFTALEKRGREGSVGAGAPGPAIMQLPNNPAKSPVDACQTNGQPRQKSKPVPRYLTHPDIFNSEL